MGSDVKTKDNVLSGIVLLCYQEYFKFKYFTQIV